MASHSLSDINIALFIPDKFLQLCDLSDLSASLGNTGIVLQENYPWRSHVVTMLQENYPWQSHV